MSTTYRIHEFAELAGVTVKALHHYDRLGLLKPKRNGTGYRLYTEADLTRLQQIVALKFIGLSLKQICDVLGDGTLPLRDALSAQRAALQDRRANIDRALAAIDRVQQGDIADASMLADLIEVLAMPDMDTLKQYFSPDAWVRWKARHATWPSAEWRELYRDAQQCLGSDPDSEEAQRLAARCIALFEAETGGDPAIRTALRKATNDREQWWAFLETAMPDVDVRRIARFLGEAAWAKWDSDGQRAFTPTVRPRASAARTALLHEFEAALGEDPRSERVRELLRRWSELTDEESGGDPDMRRMIERAGARWREWPAGMRRWVASTYDMPVETWERVMDYIDAANQESGIRNRDSGLG